MRRGEELHAGRELAGGADPDLRDVEHDAVVVGERARADRDVGAVVAEERRADDHAVPDVAEQLP